MNYLFSQLICKFTERFGYFSGQIGCLGGLGKHKIGVFKIRGRLQKYKIGKIGNAILTATQQKDEKFTRNQIEAKNLSTDCSFHKVEVFAVDKSKGHYRMTGTASE